MVLGVCRRVLPRPARRRGRLPGHVPRPGPQGRDDPRPAGAGELAPRVAFRVASRARVIVNRSRGHLRTGLEEIPAAGGPHAPESASSARPWTRRSTGSRSTIGPIVLHYFEGRTHAEIAEQLLSRGDGPQPADPGSGTAARPADTPRPRRRDWCLQAQVGSPSPRRSRSPDRPTARAAVLIAAGRAVDGLVSQLAITLVVQTLRSLSMIKLTTAVSLVLALALGVVMTGAGVLVRQGGNSSPAEAIEVQPALLRSAGPRQRPRLRVEDGRRRDTGPRAEGLVAVLGSSRLKHWLDVTDVAVSPDGAWIASASGDATVRLSGCSHGRGALRLHATPCGRWSRPPPMRGDQPRRQDDRRGGGNNAVLIWDVATGRESSSPTRSSTG